MRASDGKLCKTVFCCGIKLVGIILIRREMWDERMVGHMLNGYVSIIGYSDLGIAGK